MDAKQGKIFSNDGANGGMNEANKIEHKWQSGRNPMEIIDEI